MEALSGARHAGQAARQLSLLFSHCIAQHRVTNFSVHFMSNFLPAAVRKRSRGRAAPFVLRAASSFSFPWSNISTRSTEVEAFGIGPLPSGGGRVGHGAGYLLSIIGHRYHYEKAHAMTDLCVPETSPLRARHRSHQPNFVAQEIKMDAKGGDR